MPRGRIAQRLRLAPGQRVRLRDAQAAERLGWDEDEAKRALDANRERLEQLQYKMYADGRFGLIVLLQAIDAGGKDGTIRHVVSAFNPGGVQVTSFKAPSPEEARHDYLWRVEARIPPRGMVGVLNRSHYEEVMAARVRRLVPRGTWEARYAHINAYERYLTDNRLRLVKLFLQISKKEQKRRFEARVRERHKQWKFTPSDIADRAQWGRYQRAFEDALCRCSTAWAPWYLIPADHKWFRNFAVSQILREELEALPLRFPRPKYDPRKIRIPD